MPLTEEPSKPRLCHYERFLNLWIRDWALKLGYISYLPIYVAKFHFQTTMGDKSSYDHVELSEERRKYFGLQWQHWYFVYNTIPFGWKGSAYVYHSIGMAATSYIRSLGVHWWPSYWAAFSFPWTSFVRRWLVRVRVRQCCHFYSRLRSNFFRIFYWPIQVFAYPCSSGQIPWIFGSLSTLCLPFDRGSEYTLRKYTLANREV